MTTLPPGIPVSQDAPANSVKRTAVAISVDRVSNIAPEDSHEVWQSRLQSLQQCICELLIKNQQLRCAFMETREREPRETEGPNV
jgi:hypothetical protein